MSTPRLVDFSLGTLFVSASGDGGRGTGRSLESSGGAARPRGLVLEGPLLRSPVYLMHPLFSPGQAATPAHPVRAASRERSEEQKRGVHARNPRAPPLGPLPPTMQAPARLLGQTRGLGFMGQEGTLLTAGGKQSRSTHAAPLHGNPCPSLGLAPRRAGPWAGPWGAGLLATTEEPLCFVAELGLLRALSLRASPAPALLAQHF